MALGDRLARGQIGAREREGRIRRQRAAAGQRRHEQELSKLVHAALSSIFFEFAVLVRLRRAPPRVILRQAPEMR
jgi:hypothetical protein